MLANKLLVRPGARVAVVGAPPTIDLALPPGVHPSERGPADILLSRWVPFAALLVVGCAPAAEEATEPRTESTTSAVAAEHVYKRPSLPKKSYDPPGSNAIYVAKDGDDASGNGSPASPFQSLGRAVSVVNAKPAGGTWTVILKAGIYREGELTVTRDDVTIQRYKTDAVSILGSTALTGFSGAGPYTLSLTSVDTARFEQNCADDQLAKGAARHYGAETAFAVTRAGVPLERVAVGSGLASGRYTYEPETKQLTLHDAPTEVEVPTRLYAIRTAASNFKVAGLDIENYGSCTTDWSKSVSGTTYYKGALVIYKNARARSGAIIEDSVIANNSASGIALARGADVQILESTIINNGWTGIQGGEVDGIVVRGNDISYNNFRRWGNAVEGGIKFTHTLDGVIVDNVFEHNAATGFWCDQGCGSSDLTKRWFVVARNVVRDNDGKGIFYEVSSHAVIVSNVVYDNGAAGIASYGTRAVQIWNNTLVDNNAAGINYAANLSLVDDVRCAAGDTLPGGQACATSTAGVEPLPIEQYDHCVPATSGGALANSCNNDSIVVVNNIVSGSGSARPLFNNTVPAKTYAGALAVTESDFQAYYRSVASTPATLIEWQRDAATVVSYKTLAEFKAAIPSRELNSVESSGAAHPFFVDYAAKNFAQKTSSQEVWGRGKALPDEVLKAIHYPSTNLVQPSPPRIGAIAWADEPPPAANDPDAGPPQDDDGASPGAGPAAGGGDDAEARASSDGASDNASDDGCSVTGSSGRFPMGAGLLVGVVFSLLRRSRRARRP